jgi:hypothetical protein
MRSESPDSRKKHSINACTHSCKTGKKKKKKKRKKKKKKACHQTSTPPPPLHKESSFFPVSSFRPSQVRAGCNRPTHPSTHPPTLEGRRGEEGEGSSSSSSTLTEMGSKLAKICVLPWVEKFAPCGGGSGFSTNRGFDSSEEGNSEEERGRRGRRGGESDFFHWTGMV